MSADGGARERVVAWVLDPCRVLVAWQIAPASRVRALRRLGARARHARLAVRLVAAQAEAPVDVDPDASTVVLGAAPLGRWVAELGFRLPDGGFALVACSAPIGDPAAPAETGEAVSWVAATRPTVPVPHTWSGRRVPPASPPPAGAGPSDAFVR